MVFLHFDFSLSVILLFWNVQLAYPFIIPGTVNTVTQPLSQLHLAKNSMLENIQSKLNKPLKNFNDAKSDGFGTRARNAAVNVTKGDIIVPLCSNLEMRQILANRGVYAGVEYKVCNICLKDGVTVVSTLEGLDGMDKVGATASIKPAYPLRDYLERDDWPVDIPLENVPLWLSKATYEAGTAVGTLFFSGTVLLSAAIIAFFVQFVGVPSGSMIPALQPGDVVLVTRTIPSIGILKPKVGDTLFFDAPPQIKELEKKLEGSSISSTSTGKKQFLKRIVAVPGENVGVRRSEPYVELGNNRYRFDITGPYSKPDIFDGSSWDRPCSNLQNNEYFVAGDNGYRSVDSRIWGPLKEKYIIGTAKWVLWPLDHFGPIAPGPISEIVKPTKNP